jgi:hypothetical protein
LVPPFLTTHEHLDTTILIIETIHIVLCVCFVCLRLVYPVLPVSLDCRFLIAPSVFSDVYLLLLYSNY